MGVVTVTSRQPRWLAIASSSFSAIWHLVSSENEASWGYTRVLFPSMSWYQEWMVFGFMPMRGFVPRNPVTFLSTMSSGDMCSSLVRGRPRRGWVGVEVTMPSLAVVSAEVFMSWDTWEE